MTAAPMIDRIVSAGRKTVIVLSLLISALAGCSAFYGYVKTVGADDDDMLYLYTSGLALRSPGEYKRLSDVFIDAEKQVVTPPAFYRLDLRRDYINNYVLPSAAYWTAARLVDRFAVDYQLPSGAPAAVERSAIYPFQLVSGFALAFALCLGAVLWIAARQNDWRIALALAATLSLLAFYGLKPDGGDHRFVYLWHEARDQLWANFTVFFWNPRWYSFLHFTPRSNFALLAVGIFVLRWKGRFAASYWLLLVTAFVHQSNALLLAGLLVAIDVVSNVAFFRRRTLIPATIALAASLVRDSVWPRFLLLPTPWLIGIAVVGLAAMVLARRAARMPVLAAPVDRLRRLRSRIDATDRAVVDLLLLTVGWLLLFGICVVAYRQATVDQNVYFFQQANSRLLAVLQPVLVLGVILAALRWGLPRNRILKAVPVVLILAAAAYGAIAAARSALQIKEQLIAGSLQRFAAYEQRMRTPPLSLEERQNYGEAEIILYYSLSRSLDSGIDFVSPLVK